MKKILNIRLIVDYGEKDEHDDLEFNVSIETDKSLLTIDDIYYGELKIVDIYGYQRIERRSRYETEDKRYKRCKSAIEAIRTNIYCARMAHYNCYRNGYFYFPYFNSWRSMGYIVNVIN